MATAAKHIRKHSLAESSLNSSTKTVKFYRDGDERSAYIVTITPRKYRSFEVLLSELTTKTDLPQGVRYLLDRENGARVNKLEELKDGREYVCASRLRFERVDYGSKRPPLPHWASKHRVDLPPLSNAPRIRKISQDSSTGRSTEAYRYSMIPRRRVETKDRRLEPLNAVTTDKRRKPRRISVYRNGTLNDPARNILLNHKTAFNLGQVLDQVTAALGSNVRKLYTTNGKLIEQVSELFDDVNGIFIATGSDKLKLEGLEIINTEDAKNTTSHKRISKAPKPRHTNEGMFRYKHKYHAANRPVKSPKYARDGLLPKIYDSNNNNQRTKPDSRPGKSPSLPQKPHSPKHKRPLGKQTQNTASSKDNKHVTEKIEPNEKGVKLPQIGDGNVVTKQPVTDGQENSVGRRISKSDSVQDHVSPRVQETGRRKSKEEKTHLKKKRSSKGDLSSDSEEEKEYTRVTDKKVEDVYDIGRKVGDGNFAVVRQCADKVTKKEFALKIIDKRKIKGKEKMIDDEIAIMRRCRHKNIVRLYEDYDTVSEIYLVMKFIKGGDLFDAISSSVKFTEPVAKSYFRDMCRALAYLHKRKIVHRDIKPENLLVHKHRDGQSVIKLADFGLAMEVSVPIFTVCGTPTYVAPEILEESGYGLKVDMWAAGVITYIMLCGFPPFRSPNRDQDELFDLIQAGEFEFLSPYWDSVSQDAKDLISKLLVVDPGKRTSAEHILQHKWARLRSPTVNELSKELLEEGQVSVGKRRKRFKAAALAVQGAKRLENLMVDFHRERFISSHVAN